MANKLFQIVSSTVSLFSKKKSDGRPSDLILDSISAPLPFHLLSKNFTNYDRNMNQM